MKTYKIYSNPQGKIDAVKQGWSWPGFFFNIIWALIKKMWGLGIGLLVLFFVLGLIEGAIEVSSGNEAALVMNAISPILTLIIAIVFGVNGNKWREKRLISRGFDYKNTVNADNPEAAIALWMKESNSNQTAKK
jgi:hypothetical protein